MEHLLEGLPGVVLKPLCRFYRRNDGIAWNEAQRPNGLGATV